jgi:hypothetical protein
MRLKIIQMIDRGVPNKERLQISVVAPADLSHYAVFDTAKMAGGMVVAIPKHAYWFTALNANPGDSVILYTGPGENASIIRPDSHKNHFFHWGLQKTIWNDAASVAVLLEISTWESSP